MNAPTPESTVGESQNKDRFSFLLAFMLLLFMAQPAMRVLGVPGLTHLAFVAVLLAALYTVRGVRVGTWWLIPLVAVAAFLPFLGDRGTDVRRVIGNAAAMAFLGYCIGKMFNAVVMTPGRVTTNRLMGALCVYLLMGLFWSTGYGIIEALGPGSFSGVSSSNVDEMGNPGVGSKLSYFSYVTQTTLGYGDIAPLTDMARALASLQAIIGQLYLTVLVGRLVALHIAHAPTDAAKA